MLSFVALDLETTGLDSRTDDIIEIGMVKVIDGKEVANYQSFVRPKGKLSVKIKRLTGLCDEDLIGAPDFEDILEEVIAFIGDMPVVGHNIGFDRGFLLEACKERFTSNTFDTLELARLLLPSAANHRLADLCSLQNIDIVQQHRALDDSLAAARLHLALLSRLEQIEPELVWQATKLLQLSNSPWHSVFQAIASQMIKQLPNRKLTGKLPGAPLLEASPREKSETTTVSPLKIEECLAILGPGGELAKTLERFCHRPQQSNMMDVVLEALNENKITLAEAGTGTGKSLAYLVPSILWSKKNHHRVLIATHTINLQEQLWKKDIPLLNNLENFGFKAALMKGRTNYLCLRRWSFIIEESNHQPEEAYFLARILIWLHETTTGDRSELYIPYQELEYWYRICSESDSCMGNLCRYHNSRCFYAAAKRLADRADIIIVNHSLLLSDANSENKVLPAYGGLVIDEAHHLEACATEHLGRSIGRNEVMRWLSATGKHLVKLENMKMNSYPDNWQELLRQTADIRHRARETGTVFFEMVSSWLEKISDTGFGRWSIRFGPDGNLDELPCLPPAADSELDNLLFHLKTMSQLLARLSALLEEINPISDELASLTRDLVFRASVGEELWTNLGFICRCRQEEQVYWVEGTPQTEVVLRSAPIDVGPLLQEKLFSEQRPMILTSATLSVDGKFEHYKKSIGLNLIPSDIIIELQVDSPFNYGEQVLMCAARDIPQPGQIGDKAYHDLISEVIMSLSLAAGGRTLVLFTSHRSLREVYQRLKDEYENNEICLLGHELDGSRNRLVEQFIDGHRTVLFGSSSFWEGVDIPGESLSCVIIVKLPFAPPNQPVLESRIQKIVRQGGNGFRDYQLPQAVIKFKQGFGRLIRDQQDRGVVVVLDARLIEKRYGSKFFNSLPLAEHFRGSCVQIVSKLKSWL